MLVNLATGEKRDFEKVRRFSFAPKQSNWLAVQRYAPDGSAPGAGSDLLLVDLASGAVTSIGNVGEFAFDDAGTRLAWTIEGRDLVGNGVQVRDLKTDVVRVLDSDKAIYRKLAWADSGLALAVLRGHPDSAAADTSYAVLGYAGFTPAMKAVVVSRRATPSGFPSGLRITRRPRAALGSRSVGHLFRNRATAHDSGEQDAASGRSARRRNSRRDAVHRARRYGDDDELAIARDLARRRIRACSRSSRSRSRATRRSAISPSTASPTASSFDSARTTCATSRSHLTSAGRSASDVRGYERAGNIDGMRYHDVYVIDTRTGERKLAVKKTAESRAPLAGGLEVPVLR